MRYFIGTIFGNQTTQQPNRNLERNPIDIVASLYMDTWIRRQFFQTCPEVGFRGRIWIWEGCPSGRRRRSWKASVVMPPSPTRYNFVLFCLRRNRLLYLAIPRCAVGCEVVCRQNVGKSHY